MEHGFDPEFLTTDPITFYRGTRRRSIKGTGKILSFTPSLPVALIWSAVPGNFWKETTAHFVKGSTIHTIQAVVRNPLVLSEHNWRSFYQVLKMLRYDMVGGIEQDEVLRVYNYLHNRIIGKASGSGEFSYNVYDSEAEAFEEEEVPLSLHHPETLISWFAKEEWENEPVLETARHLDADTFIFADAPAVQRAAFAQGYDSILYPDVFQGGERASLELFGCPVSDLSGVWMEEDLHDDIVPTHWTLRLIDPSIVVSQNAIGTAEILETINPCDLSE